MYPSVVTIDVWRASVRTVHGSVPCSARRVMMLQTLNGESKVRTIARQGE
jgi:hypothetical protein